MKTPAPSSSCRRFGGVAFWERSFFRANGRPLFYAGRESIVDIQAAAQAIETMTLLGRAHDITHLERARRVARWTIRHMQDFDGHFWYQRGRDGLIGRPCSTGVRGRWRWRWPP
ncbi:MAG: hypothetical protein U0531_09925 [Dehalococcoidia bacterium]